MKFEVVGTTLLIFSIINVTRAKDSKDNEPPVKPPTLCEACKILAIELKERFEETGRSKERIKLGHGLDNKKQKELNYEKTELRLIEALHEPHICEKILEYNVHKEREGSLRFAKGISQTFQTLQSLVNRGVDVKMDIPHALWNNTSAEVSMLQRKCVQLVEDHEEDIEEWYFHHQDQDLSEYLCRNIVLKKDDYKCLYEVYVPENKEDSEIDKSKDKTKKKNKSKKSKEKDKDNKNKEGVRKVKEDL